MTRENEIIAEADCSYEGNYKSLQKLCFIEGAKWADKTMIEKVCNWIDENARGYLKAESNIIWFDSVSFRNDLRKVMEK